MFTYKEKKISTNVIEGHFNKAMDSFGDEEHFLWRLIDTPRIDRLTAALLANSEF
jgi:hypothetical protein